MKAVTIPKIVTLMLYCVALTPLVFLRGVPFEYPLGKMVFFRGLIEVAVIVVLAYALYLIVHGKQIGHVFPSIVRLKHYARHPLFIAVLFILTSAILSTVFAVNPYRAFFGDIDRQSGLLSLVHYFLFLLLSLAFFSEKEWLVFFKISIVVSTVLVFYGFLQFWDVSDFPFALPAYERSGSFIGNPAFLATHLIFTLIFASVVFFRESRPWKWFAAGVAILSLAMLFMTATRGAIIGVGAGILVFLLCVAFRKTGNVGGIRTKQLALLTLGGLLVFGIVFFATRESSLWQKIPGLDRLAATDFLNASDHASRQRILAWKLAFDLFKEKPILGWGVDNFLAGYLMRYNPELSLYGETWLDRSHNFVMDVLAMQGSVGFAALLVFFCALFYAVWKFREEHRKLKYAIVAGITAYFVQNLFLFDQTISYITLMSVVGFVVVVSAGREEERGVDTQTENEKSMLKKLCIGFLAVLGMGGAFYGLYFYNIVPYVQARAAAEVKKGGRIEDVMKNLNRAMVPYNFAQYGLRGDIVDFFYKAHRDLLANPSLMEFSDALIEGQEELIRREPFDVRPHIRIGELAHLRAEQDPSWYAKEEKTLRDAIQLSPTRPELYYHLAIALGAQGKMEEAISFLREAVAFSPEYWKSYYYLGVAYELSGNAYHEEAVRALFKAEELNPDFLETDPSDLNNIIGIYRARGEEGQAVRLIVQNILLRNVGDGATLIDFSHEEWALSRFIVKRDKKNLIALASFMARELPEAKDDLEILIDLAEKEEWEVIENVFLAQ